MKITTKRTERFEIVMGVVAGYFHNNEGNNGDGQLVKKTLTVDEELVLLAKAYNINLSQCLYKALCKYMDAKECIHKFKK